MNELEILRNKINLIDDEILDLFTKRMFISREIAEYKKHNNVAIEDKNREKEILNDIIKKSNPELKEYSNVLFETIIDLSKQFQNEEFRND